MQRSVRRTVLLAAAFASLMLATTASAGHRDSCRDQCRCARSHHRHRAVRHVRAPYRVIHHRPARHVSWSHRPYHRVSTGSAFSRLRHDRGRHGGFTFRVSTGRSFRGHTFHQRHGRFRGHTFHQRHDRFRGRRPHRVRGCR